MLMLLDAAALFMVGRAGVAAGICDCGAIPWLLLWRLRLQILCSELGYMGPNGNNELCHDCVPQIQPQQRVVCYMLLSGVHGRCSQAPCEGQSQQSNGRAWYWSRADVHRVIHSIWLLLVHRPFHSTALVNVLYFIVPFFSGPVKHVLNPITLVPLKGMMLMNGSV